MIKTISIQNYALIDSLEINFNSGFSVLTGETGAGKSIILGALGLILGQRADSRTVKQGESKCIIEGTFDISAYDLQDFFPANDLEYDAEHCILRREVQSTGKSRAFINDTPVSLAQLKELGSMLIDIHSQHQNLLLGSDAFQMRVIDTLAGNKEILIAYRSEYSRYKQLTTELRLLMEQAAKSSEETDYIRFQLEQLQEARIINGEQFSLEQELDTLNHAEDIKSSLFTIHQLLSNDEKGLLNQLKETSNKAQSLIKIYPVAEGLAERIYSDYIDLKDLAQEADSMQDSVSFNPERMEWIRERLDTIYRLQQKHHVNTEAELIEIEKQFAERLDSLDNSDERIETLRKEIIRQLSKLTEVASLLSGKRKGIVVSFNKALTEKARYLGMQNIVFETAFRPKANFDESGAENVQFLFSANKNQPLLPVAEIASGGEISRLMLVIKWLISGATALPAIIFDEIDTGVSGDIADKMGNIMKEMADNMQVITISHLPQVAGKGATHYKVFKEDTEHSTSTQIVLLTEEERITEVARMLSGSVLTKAALENAKVLLNYKHQYEKN